MKNKFLTSLRALTLLLVMCLSIGNVWGTDITSTFTDKNWNVGTDEPAWTKSGADATALESSGSARGVQTTLTNIKSSGLTLTNTTIKSISNLSKITGVKLVLSANGTGGSISSVTVNGVNFKNENSNSYAITSSNGQEPSFTSTDGAKGDIVITFASTATSKSLYVKSITVTYSTGGGSDPELSLSPTSIDFGSVEKGKSVDAKSVTATLTNTTYAAATLSGDNADAFEITAGEELTETGTITVQPKSTTLQTAGTYSASLDVEADGVTGTKSATISLTVTEPAAPTGIFTKYTGASLVEGDYVICDGTNAMNNVVTNKRLMYATVTVSSNQIENPDAAVIWHIAPSSTEGYWTMYNNASTSYAAFTSSNGNAALITTLTDYGLWQFSDGEFTNKGKTEKYLRKNGTYGFASYESSTGNKLTLYAKLASYAVSKAGDIANGDVDAQVSSASVIGQNVSVGTTVALSNTPASGYTCTGYSVYKTGDQSTTVTITDGKFTMPAYPVTVSATFAVGISAPELDLASGTYDGEQLALVDNYDDDYMYFYTNDRTDPAADGNLDPTGTSKTYDKDEGITISSSSTIKVVAYDLEGNHSAISTYTYTINPVYTSIAQFKTDQPENACKVSFTEASNVVVTAVSGKNVYVQDASGNSIILYFSANSSWTVGKKVTGYFYAKYATYLNMPEMSITNKGDVAATIDGTLPAATEITDLSAANLETKLTLFVKAKSVYFQSQSLSSKSVIVKDASENPVTLYDKSEIFGSKNLPLTATASDVTGVLIKFGYSEPYIYELLPANADAISTNGAEAQVNIDPIGGATAETAEPLALNAEVTITPVTGFATTYNTAAITEVTKVAITGNTTIAVEASRDFYTTKSVTYYYKVDESSKAIVVNQPAEGGTIAADKASASAGATITLSHSAAPHYTFGSFTVVDASSNPVTVNENEGVYTFEMPNSDVTVTGTFIENAKATATFAKGEPSATGDAPADIEWYVGENITLPANTFSFAGHKFAGWNDGANVYAAGASYEMPEGGKAFTATWEALSVWATTYTSNVTGIGTSNKVKISGTDYNANKQNKGASTSVTVPAGATALHFHALAWTGEAQTITVSGTCFTEALPFDIVADAGISGSGSTYTLQTDPSQVGYFSIPLSDIEADTKVTFQAASNKRFVLFGVNAVQPASMTIEPTEWDFGNVKENASADKVFAVTPNAFVEGALSATFEGADAAKFSAVVDGNNVTVTFTPAAQGAMEATLKVSASNANVTASLSGTGIPATTPEIVVPADPVNFGKIKQETSVSDQQVTVTLNNLDAATASISGSVFSIDKTALVAGENTITISANSAASAGEYSETITITGTGAEEKQITVNMEILSKWADTYTSNVEVGTDEVIINKVTYEAIKKGTGTASQSATITVPKGTQTLHFHAAAWNNEATVLVVKQGDTQLGSFDLYKDAGVKSSSPFTLEGNNYSTEQYFHVGVAAYTETDEADITFTTTASPYRFVLYGVNQEGGIVPVLDHLVIEGTATKTEYEVGDDFDPTGMTVNAIYTLEDVEQKPIDVTDDVEWTYVPATLTAGSYNVTATANYEGKSVSKDIAVTISAATPEITVSPTSVDFGSVEQNASVDAKTVAVTLKAIEGNATVELSGAGASAFTVTPASLSESGDITITPSTATVGVFAAVITISAKDAESVEIPVSMTVTEVAPTYTYTLVTDASDLMPGDVIIIGTAITNGFKVASSYNSTDKLLSPTDDGDATEAEGVVTTGYAMEFILGGTEGSWTLTSNDGVLGVYAAKKITFDPSVNNYTNTWTIAIDANNKATIASTNSSYGKILYNVSSPRFLNYTSDATSTMLLPKIYRKDNKGTVTTVRTDLTIGRYGTICLPRGIEVGQFTGAIFYSITYKDVANSLLIADEVKSLEAGRPYLFLATDTKIKARLNDDAVSAPVNDKTNNGLYGVFEKLEITEDNTGKYLLSNDVLYNAAAGSWLAPNRAYVVLSEVSETVVGQVAGRRRMVASTPKSTPTDVEEIFNAQSVDGKFMINGQLFILRDGKTYDAQGKLVK